METNLEYSTDVTIPGLNEPAEPSRAHHEQPAYAAVGMDNWALQEACKRELSLGVYPKFYIKAVEDKIATREKGRPMFRDQEWVCITLRGDRNSITDRPVKDNDRQARWPALYTAFKNGQSRSSFGTPLEDWPLMTRSQIETLKHYNIFTVEDLAGLDDRGIQQVGMGSREWMEQAKAYIDAAEDSAAPAKLVAKIEQMQQQMDALRLNNNQLGAAAENSATHQEDVSRIKSELIENETLLNDVRAKNASLETQLSSLQAAYDTEKQEHISAKRNLTRARNDLEALKAKE